MLLPAGDRGAAAAGLCMYTASKPVALLVQEIAFWAVRAAGPRVLPGRRLQWRPPMSSDEWAGLLSDWGEALGPFDHSALYQRRQAHRTGLTLVLCRSGRPRAIVKVRDEPEGLLEEQRALARFQTARPRTFRVPEPLGGGHLGRWHWTAQSAVFRRPHRPVLAPDPRMFDEIRDTLDELFAPKEGTVASHNDLTPWNLRREPRGAVWLFDWEDAGPAPLRSDETYFHTALAGIRRTVMPVGLPTRTVAYWHEIVAQRLETSSADDAVLARRMLRALDEAQAHSH